MTENTTASGAADRPEALKLASILRGLNTRNHFGNKKLEAAADELERLHALAASAPVAPTQAERGVYLLEKLEPLLEAVAAGKSCTIAAGTLLREVRNFLPSTPQAAPVAPTPPKLFLNGFQLRAALDFIAPDGDDEQLESEVCIQHGPERTHDEGTDAAGMYCWLSDYPEEGSIRLDDEASAEAAPVAPAPVVSAPVKIVRDFRWDSYRQHHVPTLLLEFEPVPANSPIDAKGWNDRDDVAIMLAAAPKAAPITEAEQAAWHAGIDEGRSQAPAPLQQGEYTERDAFESEFTRPSGVEWNGAKYVTCDSSINSYRCDRFVGQWEAWRTRASRGAAQAEGGAK